MKMNNLNLIANHLFNHPGAKYADITRMLCNEKGKDWHRGMYSQYFTKKYQPWHKDRVYADILWEKTGCGGWVLTLKGMCYVTGDLNAPAS